MVASAPSLFAGPSDVVARPYRRDQHRNGFARGSGSAPSALTEAVVRRCQAICLLNRGNVGQLNDLKGNTR